MAQCPPPMRASTSCDMRLMPGHLCAALHCLNSFQPVSGPSALHSRSQYSRRSTNSMHGWSNCTGSGAKSSRTPPATFNAHARSWFTRLSWVVGVFSSFLGLGEGEGALPNACAFDTPALPAHCFGIDCASAFDCAFDAPALPHRALAAFLAASERTSASDCHGLYSRHSCRTYPSSVWSIHMPRHTSKNACSSPCQSAASSMSSQSMPERLPSGRLTAAQSHKIWSARTPSSPRRFAVLRVLGCCQKPTERRISVFMQNSGGKPWRKENSANGLQQRSL